MKELKIDPELRDLLPPMTDEEYKKLEKNIVENGFDKNFPVMEWKGFIADGHNRYSICKKHNIEPAIGKLAYETKEEVMKWMLDIQLGRRNLSPIQRISIAEKYRSIYEKQARENQGTRNDLKDNIPQNIGESDKRKQAKDREVNSKLAKVANVNPETYRQAKRILDSNNEDLKKRVQSGETSISAGYKELIGKTSKQKENISNETTTTQPPIVQKETLKPIVENGVVLLPEDSKENKIMNDIARQMKSGVIDSTHFSNEKEIKNISSITKDAISSIFNYIFGNIDFDNFSKEVFDEIENIMMEAKETINNNMKIMEGKINE